MKRELFLYKIMSYIHIVFFISVCMVGITVLSGTLLSIPAIGAGFLMGKEQLYHRLDVNDSIIKLYFKNFKKALTLLRFLPINIVFLLDLTASRCLATTNQTTAILFLALAALTALIQLYVIGYWTFVDTKMHFTDVCISIFIKPQLLFPLYVCLVLSIFFCNMTLLTILFFTGAFFLFAVEVVIFIQMLNYKNLTDTLDKDEEYKFLVKRKDITWFQK